MGVVQGQLLSEMVVQMNGQTRALERVAELPVEAQERLPADEPVELYRGEGRTESLPLREMLFRDAALAIRDGRILTA